MKSYMIGALALVLTACGQGEAATPANVNAPSLTAELPALSGEHIWRLDTSKSSLKFKANYNGLMTGEFKNFDAVIRLDPDNLDMAEIHAVIGLDSVSAKDSDVTDNLPLAEWFHTAKFPLAVFSSTEVSRDSVLTYRADGMLSLKGVSKPVSISFDLDITGDMAKATGTAKLSRQDFAVGTGPDFIDESWVKFPVDVVLDITANR